jgi:hypothetical protein
MVNPEPTRGFRWPSLNEILHSAYILLYMYARNSESKTSSYSYIINIVIIAHTHTHTHTHTSTNTAQWVPGKLYVFITKRRFSS